MDEQIQKMIDAVAEAAAAAAVARYISKMPCGLTPESAKELPHLMGCFKDMGGGSDDGVSRGIEVFRKNQAFNQKWRRACEHTGSVVLMTIVVGACALAALITGHGFWVWLKSGIEHAGGK